MLYDPESRYRGQDRLRIYNSYHQRRRFHLLWLLIGPGVLVMLGENDAPSMLSYAATGSKYGVGFFLPFVILTFAMAFVAQEMTVRLGAVSKTGHADLIYRRFGRLWGNFSMVDLLVTNVMTLITEFVGIVAGAGYFGIPAWMAVAGALFVISCAVLSRGYWRWERMTLATALFNLVFIPVAILVHPQWGQVAHAVIHWGPLPGGVNQNTVVLALADIGATITPWMLFFQQGAVSDKGLVVQDIRHGRWDTALGALLATLAAGATIIATAALFSHHMNASQYGAAQFAQALVPYAGRIGASLFALGILEAGLVAAITISTSSAYAFGEASRRPHSLNGSFKGAQGFYIILFAEALFSGAMVLIPGFPLEMVVIVVNVVAVLTMPPAIGFLLILANDEEIMGSYKNTRFLNFLGIGVGVFVSGAGILYALTVILPFIKL